MSNFRDLRGQQFGRLKVLSLAGRQGKGYAWLCKCECGTRKVVASSNLVSGGTVSCGCFRTDELRKRSLTHGHTINGRGTPTYQSYNGMLDRCLNEAHPAYADYGGRGITVCKRWRSENDGFPHFLEDMGERPKGTTLERIRNQRGYSPGNCKWATGIEQGNNKRSSRKLRFKGEVHTVAEWARILGINPATLHTRLYNGWPVAKALTGC